MKTAQHVMTRALHTISPDASVADASRKMQQHKIQHQFFSAAAKYCASIN